MTTPEPPSFSPSASLATEISICIPIYNEEHNISPLCHDLESVMHPLTLSYELIFVDDGSTDASWLEIKKLTEQTPHVKALRFTRNFGHQAALYAGLSAARGAAVITMDGDFQHPPAVISDLVFAWKHGAKIVQTLRYDPPESSYFKLLSSKSYYKLYSLLSNHSINEGQSDFRLLDKTVLSTLLALPYNLPFLRGTLTWLGYQTTYVTFTAGQRRTGTSKFTLRKMFALANNGIISYSAVPLIISLIFGTLALTLAISFLILAVTAYFIGFVIPGWTSLASLMSFMFSSVLFSLAIISLYINSIHVLVKQQPLYVIADSIGGSQRNTP